MKKVTGIGGIFYKVSEPQKHKKWYKEHLGIESDEYGGKFIWRDLDDPKKKCITAWSPFPDDTKYFDPSKQTFMVNYRVDDLVKLFEELKKEGVTIVGEIEDTEYGKFGWILDPEGFKIELWEPKDEPLL